MKALKNTFSFTGLLEQIPIGLIQTVIIVPPEILNQIDQKGRVRVKGLMNGVPFALAIQFMKTGERYFSVSASLRKDAKIKVGDPVRIEFHIVDSNVVELPEELEVALSQDPEATLLWNALTAGKQRSLAHYVISAKSTDSRIKRSLELLYKLKTRQLHGQSTSKD